MKTIIISLLVIICALNNIKAQDVSENPCTSNHEQAFERMTNYLTWGYLKEMRINAGIDNIPIEQISHVDSPAACIKITAILNEVPKLKNIMENMQEPKFYYQSNDFYYVFWMKILDDGMIRLGPKTIFIVINIKTEEIFTDYI